MQLVEDAVDGCWIGYRARSAVTGDNGIGSVYSPPKDERGSPVAVRKRYVETVVDIGHRPEVWIFFATWLRNLMFLLVELDTQM
jgi:hypothetical protein